MSESLHLLDARRMLCPMPVIKTQDKVKTLQSGDILLVTCTDPGALSDIPTWCQINGHTVLETSSRDDEVLIKIQVRG